MRGRQSRERPGVGPVEQRLKAFRAVDAFVVEAYRLSTSLDGSQGRELAREIRRAVSRCGGSLVASSAAKPSEDNERRSLELASMGLAEGRYYLYLARRFGLLDLRRYRAIMTRQDAARRELDQARAKASNDQTSVHQPPEVR